MFSLPMSAIEAGCPTPLLPGTMMQWVALPGLQGLWLRGRQGGHARPWHPVLMWRPLDALAFSDKGCSARGPPGPCSSEADGCSRPLACGFCKEEQPPSN